MAKTFAVSARERLRRGLDDLFEEFGTWRVIVAPLAGLSFVATSLGFFFQTQVATASVLGATLGLVLLGVFALIGILRQERKQRHHAFDVVRRLTAIVLDQQTPASYVWEDWEEVALVSRGGDMALHQWRTLRAGHDPVRVVWAAYEQTPAGHLTDAQRRRVAVSAHSYSVRNGERELGPSFELTEVWQENVDALVVYACLDEPVPPGETRNFLFVWKWPGCYKWLLAGHQDTVFFQRKRGTVGILRLTLTFDHSCHLRGPMLVRAIAGSPTPEQTVNGDGSVVLRATYGPDRLPDSVGFIMETRK